VRKARALVYCFYPLPLSFWQLGVARACGLAVTDLKLWISSMMKPALSSFMSGSIFMSLFNYQAGAGIFLKVLDHLIGEKEILL
jgi:hypothetical protein